MAGWDWSATSVGPPERWPASLHNMIRVLLSSRFSMWLGWGPELAFFYNDAYHRDTLRGKHPWALGRPAREVWAEIWHDIGPRIQSVLDTGEATWDERLQLLLERAGYPEETYHTFSYSPLVSDDGSPSGILCVVREDTQRVLSERRLRVLSELGEVSALTSTTVEQACAAALEVLAGERQDVPFGVIYLVDEPPTLARRAAFFGVLDDARIVPVELDRGREPNRTVWQVLDAGRPVVADLTDRYRGMFVPGAWPMGGADPKQLVAMPLAGAGRSGPCGVLFAGVSPLRALDQGYGRFLHLVAKQVSAAIRDAQTLEAQRRRADELTALDRAKTEFFTGVSHELRTPLTLIAGPAEDALADVEHPLPEEQRNRLELISRNAARLRRLVDSLLQVSQVEEGRLIPAPVAVDLPGVTLGIAESFAPALRRAGLRFEINCPPMECAVAVDVDMWEKIVLNLLSNAVKYTLSGQVQLSLQRVDAGTVRLRVTDTGIGIPAEEQPRLFERFHRVRGAAGRSHEGSGIGLALVAELAALHDGTVDVQSSPGRGSTFTVELPDTACTTERARKWEGPESVRFYRDEAVQWSSEISTEGSALDTAAAAADFALSGQPEPLPTVLVAEDNPDLRRFIAGRLRPHYRVLLTPDGPSALELTRTHHPDLVLSDVMMPGLDGFELLAALRSDRATATIPIILLSAQAGPEAVGQGLAAGADDYLVKPFSSDDLLARVHSNLALARLRGQEGAWRTALLNAITDGMFVLDAEGAVVETNAAFTDMLGFGPDGLPYRPPYPWWPDAVADPDGFESASSAHRRIVSGEKNGRWQTALHHRDGHRIWVEASTATLPDRPWPERKVVGVVRDITAQHRAAKRDRLLADTGRALTRPGELSDRLEQCARAAAAVLDELVLIIQTRTHGRQEVVAAAHRTRSDLVRTASRITPGRLPEGYQARFRDRHAFVLDPAPAELLGTGPEADATRAAIGEHSVLLAPLPAGTRLHGSLAIISVGGRRDAAAADLAMAEELGRRIAGAMETDRLGVLEHRLHDASDALSAAATVEEASAALAEAVRESMDASVAMVFTPDPDDPSSLRMRHVSEGGEWLRADFGALPVNVDSATSEAARSNHPIWVSDQRSWLERYPRLARAPGIRGMHAVAALPIGTGDRLSGVLSVGFETERSFPEEERRIALTLVAQAGQAFARATRSDDRWRVSRTLQDSLLPAALPTFDRLSLVAHYEPAGLDSYAGGDWYDVIALDETRVAVVVGDVVGNGPAAAATMGKLSSALAAYLREGHGPAHALDLLSGFARGVPQALGSTAACMILDTGTGEVRGASAGHPPPLVLRPDERASPDGGSPAAHLWEALAGVSLGVGGAPRHEEVRMLLSPGSSILLYSDGLIERRQEDIDEGLRRLCTAAAPHAGSAPHQLSGAVLDGCLPATGPTDDVVLVVARYLPDALHGEIAAAPEQLGVVRRTVSAWATQVGLPEERTYDLQLAAGEAVANAIEHAYRDRPAGTVGYRVALTGSGDVHVRVHDHGEWRTPAADPGFRGRGLDLIRALTGPVTITHTRPGTVLEFTLPGPGPAPASRIGATR